MIRCSNLARIAACPGSYYATLGLKEEWSDAARQGTLMHKAAETGDYSQLDARQTKLVERAIAQRDELITRLFGEDRGFVLTEKRINNYELRLSGQLDYGMIAPLKALIVDYKFGDYGVEDADTNLQMRGYATLFAASNLCPQDVMDVYCAIIQPSVTDDPVVVQYSRSDLRKAWSELSRLIDRALGESPVRKPSAECRFCVARATDRCPESQAMVLWPEAPIDIPAEVLGELLNRWTIAKPIGSKLEEIAKARLAAGEVIPGWKLKENAPRSSVSNVMAAWARIEDLFTPEQFAQACSVAIGKLEATYREEKGCTWQEAKDEIRKRLADVLVRKEIAPSLVPE